MNFLINLNKIPWISKELGDSSRAYDGEGGFCPLLCSTANLVRRQHDMRIRPLSVKVTSTFKGRLARMEAVNLGSCKGRFTELKRRVLFGG
jgi:hypothetical protein